MANYYKTDLRTYCNDVMKLGGKIARRLEERDQPLKGSWETIEERVDAVAAELMFILTDLDGDQ
jgi:hypothetical protein